MRQTGIYAARTITKKHQGFSFIELLIVLVIIGILASVSYPSYRQYILRAHRLDGQTALFLLANQMEQYYADHHSYQKASIGTKNKTDVLSSNLSSEGWYHLAITETTDTSFSLQATAIGAQINDTNCQTLTLNSRGIKGSKTDSSHSPCW